MNMKKVLLKVSIVLTLFLMQVAAPFSLYAENTYPFSIDNVVGVNVYQDDQYDSTFYNVIEIILDNDYYGQADFKVGYYLGSSGTMTYFTKTCYFYGHSIRISVPTSNQSIKRQGAIVQTITNASVYALNNLDFPFESYTPVAYAMNNLDYSSMLGLFEWTYPTFYVEHDLTYGAIVFEGYVQENVENYFIFGISQLINTNSQGNRYIEIYTKQNNSNDQYLCTIQSMDYVTSATYLVSDGSIRFYWFKVKYKVNTAGYLKIAIYNQNDFYYVPIYHANSTLDNISTDFALRFGLSNKLLKSLENLSGNVQSDSSADNLNDNSDDMQDAFDDMFSVENGYNNQLNNELQNIDFTNPIQNNNSMLSSGNFVISIFNSLIANNPITILIVIMAILMVARRLFG